MDAVNRSVRRAVILGILMTIMLIAGVPLIIVGAVKGWWPVMGVGIAFAVIGFYGTPMAWVNLPTKKQEQRIVSAIVDEHIYNVSELSQQLSLTDKEVRNILDVCFRKRFLDGYRRDGDNILLNEGKALGKQEYAAACPNCGAKFSYTKDAPRCPYCGSPVMQENVTPVQ